MPHARVYLDAYHAASAITSLRFMRAIGDALLSDSLTRLLITPCEFTRMLPDIACI